MGDHIKKLDFDFTGHIFIAILVGFISIVILWRVLKSKAGRDLIILMGLCESGKTLLFAKLCHGMDVISVTSIKETESYFDTGKKRLKMCDLPGHERLRYSMFEKVKHRALGIIFVIDSAMFQKNLKDVAEFLFTMLCDSTVQSSLRHLLVLCNKQDLPLAKASGLVKATLEKEINLLRTTHGSKLKSLGQVSNSSTFIGHRDKDFEFCHLSPIHVVFEEASCKEEGLDPVRTWLRQL